MSVSVAVFVYVCFIVGTLSAKNDYNRLFISNKTVGSLLLGAKHLLMYQSEQYYNSNFHALEVEGRGYRRFCFKKTVGFQVLIFFFKGQYKLLIFTTSQRVGPINLD